jgi:exonuclease VII large subunit
MIFNMGLRRDTGPGIALSHGRRALKTGARAMAASGADSNSLLQAINQLRQQVGALERQHSRSVSQAIRPLQGELEQVKVELRKAKQKFDTLEKDFKGFQAAERERRRRYDKLTAGLLDARSATVAAESEIAVIDSILADALPFRSPSFDELTDPGLVADFGPGPLGVAEPGPRWDDYDPGPADLLSRAVGAIGLTGGHERRVDDAQARYRTACDAHRDRELRDQRAIHGADRERRDQNRRPGAGSDRRAGRHRADSDGQRPRRERRSRERFELPPVPHQCFCNKRRARRPISGSRSAAIVPGHRGRPDLARPVRRLASGTDRGVPNFIHKY